MKRKKMQIKKISITQDFMLISNLLTKKFKKCIKKKLLSKSWLFQNHDFFNVFEISVNLCVFWLPCLMFKKKFKVKLVLFSIFDVKRAKNGPKNQTNVVCKCVLDLHFAPIKGSVFLKKVKFIIPNRHIGPFSMALSLFAQPTNRQQLRVVWLPFLSNVLK